MNYPGHIIYEIYTNQGYFYVSQDKSNDKLEIINGLALSSKNVDFSEYKTNKEKTLFLPALQ